MKVIPIKAKINKKNSVNKLVKKHKFKPTLIKIDVEGWEDVVLEGMKEVMKTYKPRIILEAHGKEKFDKYEYSENFWL